MTDTATTTRMKDLHLLTRSRVATRLPAQDLDRARAFYAEKLGLEPAEERDGGLLYRVGEGSFALFASTGAASGESTQMGFEVDDIEAVVSELRARGLEFEEVDTPGLETTGGIAEVAGNYPSKGTGERACWFRDSEGNLLGLGQPVGAPSKEKAPAEIARAFTEAWGAGDFDTAARFVDDAVVFDGPLTRVSGKAALLAALQGFAAAITRVDVLAVHGDEREALLLYEMVTGPFGTLRTGERLVITDGLIVRDEIVFDTHAVRGGAG